MRKIITIFVILTITKTVQSQNQSYFYNRIDSALTKKVYWIRDVENEKTIPVNTKKISNVPGIIWPDEAVASYKDSTVFLFKGWTEKDKRHDMCHMIVEYKSEKKFGERSREEQMIEEFYINSCVELFINHALSEFKPNKEYVSASIYKTAMFMFRRHLKFYQKILKKNQKGSYEEALKHLRFLEETFFITWKEFGLPFKGKVQIIPDNKKDLFIKTIFEIMAK